MKAYTFKRILLCTLLAALMLFSVSAATWEEMRENGAVSDGGVRLGDARDGIVSDVSDHTGDNGVIGDIITDASDLIHDGLNGIDGTDHGVQNGTDRENGTDNLFGDPMPETTAAPNTTAPHTTDNGMNNTDGNTKGGMSMGIIIAILVVIAVIVVIFLLLPKRK